MPTDREQQACGLQRATQRAKLYVTTQLRKAHHVCFTAILYEECTRSALLLNKANAPLLEDVATSPELASFCTANNLQVLLAC